MAAATYTTAGALRSDTTFQSRVRVAMTISARNTVNGAGTNREKSMAQDILRRPDGFFSEWMDYVCSRIDVIQDTNLLTTDAMIQTCSDAAFIAHALST